jgi:hypothetical protein
MLQLWHRQLVPPPPLQAQAQPSLTWGPQEQVSDFPPQWPHEHMAQTPLHPHFSAKDCLCAAASSGLRVWHPDPSRATPAINDRIVFMAHPH